jgi:hypothetical protein
MKRLNIKFHEISFRDSRLIARGQGINVAKLTGAFLQHALHIRLKRTIFFKEIELAA